MKKALTLLVDGENPLLLINDYSRFPFVEPVSSISASAVIPKLDKLFATSGTPCVVKSDNCPPFNGEEFAKFASALCFKHRRVTPLWLRANGEVKRLVKTLEKCNKAAKAKGKNWRKELQALLRNYRTTPHATTDITPATLLLKRAVRTDSYSGYLSVFWDERRLGIGLRRAQDLMGREEGKIALYPSHETPRAPQPNPHSSLIPKNT